MTSRTPAGLDVGHDPVVAAIKVDSRPWSADRFATMGGR
jgi:hypothetical protein